MQNSMKLKAIITVVLCLNLAAADAAPETAEEKSRALNKDGAALLSAGKAQEAAEQFRKSIQIYPQGASAHNNLALVLKELGQIVEAEKEARAAIKLRNDKASYHFNLGIILQHQNKFA